MNGKRQRSHLPSMHGYNANDIKNWNPETDENAKYFRSRVPLAERIPTFSPTQANPRLSAEPQVMNLSADYDKENEGFKYNERFCCNVLKFWQYTDLYGAWHGLPVEGSPKEEPLYGVINLPNPAYTDAAHRNGVISLACWFWPREEQVFSDWVEQSADGSFPIADKMIEIAAYFGFDGYFINQEASISEEDAKKLLEMMTYLRQKAPSHFHLQWYDTILRDGTLRYQNQFNHRNSPWIIDGTGAPVVNSMFINYAWNEKRLADSYAWAKELGLDPFRTLFPGTENDKYGYNPPYDTRLIFPEGGAPLAGWGLFGTDFVWNKYKNKFDPNDQEEVYRRERRYWSGPTEDPTDRVGRTLYEPYPDPFHAVNPEEYKCWDGVAHYIPERSAIGSYPFVTRFNTGHGKAFFLQGRLASAKEWNNAGIQDILPSWQWWIQRFDAKQDPLDENRPVSERPLQPSFDYSIAYDGGSSLKVSGLLEASVTTELRLFKTKLPVTNDVNMAITYKTGMRDVATNMAVGLIFEDAPNHFAWLDVGHSTCNDWNTRTFRLEAFTGRTIAAIGLRFASSSQSDYTIHIGELALTNNEQQPSVDPTGFSLDEVYFEADQAELFLSWDFDTEGVWFYDLHRVKDNGQRELIGRTYDDVYYVKSLRRLHEEKTSYLELIAVSFDGAKSGSAELTLDWP